MSIQEPLCFGFRIVYSASSTVLHRCKRYIGVLRLQSFRVQDLGSKLQGLGLRFYSLTVQPLGLGIRV